MNGNSCRPQMLMLNMIWSNTLIQEVDGILKVHNRPWSNLQFTMICFLLAFVFIAGSKFIALKKIRGFQLAAALLLTFCMAVILQSTVFTRGVNQGKIELELFWSWKEAYHGNKLLFQEVVLNIIMFFPLGLLLPVLVGKRVPIWKSALFGILFSLLIESLQLVLKRGLFELDDLVDNGLGCVLGTLIMNLILMVSNRYRK